MRSFHFSFLFEHLIFWQYFSYRCNVHLNVCTWFKISHFQEVIFRGYEIYRATDQDITVYVPILTCVVIIIFFHGLGRLTCSGIDALPSFPEASTTSSSSRFVVEGVFRESGVVHSFKVDDPVFFCIWVSRLVFQRSPVLFLWHRFLFYPVLGIL